MWPRSGGKTGLPGTGSELSSARDPGWLPPGCACPPGGFGLIPAVGSPCSAEPAAAWSGPEGQVSDFVEKDRAALGLVKHTGMIRNGMREGTLPVAEKLALQNGFRQSRTIDRNQIAATRRLSLCIAWAASSLPVPVSPRIRTVTSDWASILILSNTADIGQTGHLWIGTTLSNTHKPG